MSNAFSGVGVQFQAGDGASSEAFTAIAEVNSISGPSISRDTIDVTSLDSSGGYREFIGGFRDGGSVNLNMNFTLETYDDFKDNLESETSQNFKIVFPATKPGAAASAEFAFAGLVTELSLEIPMDDKVTANVTIKIDGSVDITS